ncbi:MAG: hypothetical protein ACOH18_02785 [Candidatus Saccharimonadaceae bacterium]
MMTEKETYAPTLTERSGGSPQKERRYDEDDGETIVRGEDHLKTIDIDAEILHAEVVNYLTNEAKELAL